MLCWVVQCSFLLQMSDDKNNKNCFITPTLIIHTICMQFKSLTHHSIACDFIYCKVIMNISDELFLFHTEHLDSEWNLPRLKLLFGVNDKIEMNCTMDIKKMYVITAWLVQCLLTCLQNKTHKVLYSHEKTETKKTNKQINMVIMECLWFTSIDPDVFWGRRKYFKFSTRL